MGDKVIQMPDGRVISFPAGMPDDAISAVLRGGSAKQVVSQGVLDNLKAASANPTQFEKDRPGSNRPGGGGFGQFMNTLGSMFTPSGDMRGLERTNIAPSSPQIMDQKQAIVNAATAADQSRKQAGYSSGYRAAAPFVPGAPQMEESARRGDPNGVLGAAMAPASIAVGAYAGPKIAGAIGDAIPSTERAGANFQAVIQAAGDRPVNVAAVNEASSRALELASRGGNAPKVITDFIDRIKSGQPLTYAEARDFAVNASRLSSGEFGNLNPVMHRQVSLFAKSLNEAIGETAANAGVGPQYQSAMKEFSRAKKLEAAKAEASQITGTALKNMLTKGLPLAGAAYGAKKIYDAGQ